VAVNRQEAAGEDPVAQSEREAPRVAAALRRPPVGLEEVAARLAGAEPVAREWVAKPAAERVA